MDANTLVIYHARCADGFTSAWLVNQYVASGRQHEWSREWVVAHHAGVYGDPPPPARGRFVYIVDFSYAPDAMLAIAEQAQQVVWIDHHATAIKAMQGIEHPRLMKIVSTERSGAYLTSKFLWPDREPLDMVKLVDDRDRWQFKDPRSRPFAAGLFARPYAIGEWNRAARNVGDIVAAGQVIETNNAKNLVELLDQMTVWQDIGGTSVPTANLTYQLASDACAELLRRHPNAPFACTWFVRNDGKRVHSLRSREGSDVDVGTVAQALGGGGHKHAAGFAL